MTPAGEPEVFDLLTNGGFEVVRADGTGYGWHNVGGVDRVIEGTGVQGRRSLEISSSTSSTKWAYQTVRVQPGAWYKAATWARASQSEAFLRLSWYAAGDGSGRSIESSDSTLLVAGDEFGQLVTDAVQAPAEARTVKVRLMLRPSSADQGMATFDDVKLTLSTPEVGEPGSAFPSEGDARNTDRSNREAQVRALTGADTDEADPQRTVRPLANISRSAAEHDPDPIVDSTGSSVRVALLVLVFVSLLVIAAIMAREIARPDRD